MKLREISVKNFRCLVDATIPIWMANYFTEIVKTIQKESTKYSYLHPFFPEWKFRIK